MHDEALRVARPRFNTDPSLEDDMLQYKYDLDLFFENLIIYRAHLAHKHSESKFDKKFYKSFDSIEVVVISDWKMKILASKYREAQHGKQLFLLCMISLNDKYVLITIYSLY